MLSLSKAVFTLAVVGVCFSAASLSPAIAAEKFKVNLIATIDNGPAMESVEWTVYRNGNEKVTTAKKHSAHIKVPPGKYKAVARLVSNRNITRTRSFYVRNDTEVVVPMD